METVVADTMYICPKAKGCLAKLCGHRVAHPRDVDDRGDHCKATPAWAKHCPACRQLRYQPDPRD